jgi:hypothetical protein
MILIPVGVISLYLNTFVIPAALLPHLPGQVPEHSGSRTSVRYDTLPQ